jgi:hypothetical protein
MSNVNQPRNSGGQFTKEKKLKLPDASQLDSSNPDVSYPAFKKQRVTGGTQARTNTPASTTSTTSMGEPTRSLSTRIKTPG